MRENIVRITTADTKKTYEFPGDNPQIWEIKLSSSMVGPVGNPQYGFSTDGTIYLERETLENAGLRPKNKPDTAVSNHETIEDLIIRMLEHLGYYPAE
jgi:hypothetical protein